MRPTFFGFVKQSQVGGGVPTNWALASNGATITATTELDATSYPKGALINGLRHTNNQWGVGGAWASAAGVSEGSPETIEITLAGTKSITEINVITLADAASYNTEPTLSDTFALYGVTAYTVDYWNGSSWVNLATVSGNDKVWRQHTFSAVSTTKIRVVITAALNINARMVEVEAVGT
jgi:hypothetical protein